MRARVVRSSTPANISPAHCHLVAGNHMEVILSSGAESLPIVLCTNPQISHLHGLAPHMLLLVCGTHKNESVADGR